MAGSLHRVCPAAQGAFVSSSPGRRAQRMVLAGGGLLTLAALSLIPGRGLALGASRGPDFDGRASFNQGFALPPAVPQQQALERLRARVPALAASRNRSTGVLTVLYNHAGHLTAESLGTPAREAAFLFLYDNLELLGLDRDDLASAEVSEHPHPDLSGVTDVVLLQSCQGLRLYEGRLRVSVTSDGQIARVENGFLPRLCQSVAGNRATVDFGSAAAEAARHAGADARPGEAAGELTWLAIRSGMARLAWHVRVRDAQARRVTHTLVDAQSGAVWLRSTEEEPQASDAPTEPLAATPCVGGLAGEYACNGIDLMARLPLSSFPGPPSSASSIWGIKDMNDNKEYAIIGLRNGTSVVEVTDPVNPRIVGTIPGVSSSWREVKAYQIYDQSGNRWKAYAYVSTEGSGGGIQVIDLTQLPNSVSLAATWTGVSTSHSLFVSNVDSSTGVANNPSFAPFLYVNGSNRGGFRIVSLANPTSLTEVGSWTGTYAHEVYTHVFSDSRANQCAPGHNPCEVVFTFAGSPGIKVVDATDKSAPTLISTFTYPNLGYTHSGWISQSTNHMLVNDELDEGNTGNNTRILVVGLGSLTSLSLAQQYFGPTKATDHNAFVVGNKSYYSSYTRGVAVLDVGDPTNPAELAFFDTYPASNSSSTSGAWGVYPFLPSGTIVVSDIQRGLFVLKEQISDLIFADGFQASTKLGSPGR